MAEPFRVDPTVLADAVARMAEFGRHVEELVAEIESLVTLTAAGQSAHANYTGAMATNLGMWS